MVSAATAIRSVLLMCLCVCTGMASAAYLRLDAQSREIELGKPLWLTITTDQTAASLNTLDLNAWQQQFVLPRREDAAMAEDGRSQTLRVRLYPLRKGGFTLPALHFGTEFSEELAVQVTEAKDPKNHLPIDFSYTVSTSTPWQRQQVIVSCTLTTREAHAIFEQAPVTHTGMQILPMQLQQQTLSHSMEQITRHTLGWVVIPARAGTQSVSLPPIQYVRDGVATHQFYVPSLALEVQALPAWLPATVPVGRVSVTKYVLTQPWLNTGVLAQLQLQVQLDGVAPGLIPAYPQQLRSDNALQYYAVQQTSAATIGADGIAQQLRYEIPLVAKQLGVQRLPALRVQYFDPDRGVLQTLRITGPQVIILNHGLVALLLLLLAALGYWLGRWAYRWLCRIWRRFQTYQQALQRLPHCQTLPEIKNVLQLIASAEGWPTNFTYGQWQAHLQAVSSLAHNLAVHKLNAAGYGRQQLDTATVVAQLVQICRQRRWVWW